MALIGWGGRWHWGAMPHLGPPNRGSDPLHAWIMALALIAAAGGGAGLGFLIDLVGLTGQEAGQTPPPS